MVSESGLYALILTSRKPQAKAFRRWVTGEVIPSIRKTGHYTLPGGAAEAAPGDPKTARVMLPDYGRYVITHRPGGIFLHQTGFDEGLPEVTATDCQILSHTLLLIDGYWQRLQYMRASAVDFQKGYSFAQLEKAILEGARLGKHCLEFHPRGTH